MQTRLTEYLGLVKFTFRDLHVKFRVVGNKPSLSETHGELISPVNVEIPIASKHVRASDNIPCLHCELMIR